MFNFMILYGKNGISQGHYGLIPNGYTPSMISGLALMVDFNSKGIKEVTTLKDKDYTIFIKPDEEPYALINDGSVIKIIRGNHLNAVVSINNECDLLPAKEMLKVKDKPINKSGCVEKSSLDDVLDKLIHEQARLLK